MAVIRGRVVGPGGGPVQGARVFLAAAPGPFPDIAALTGPDGSFAFGAPDAGDYRVEAVSDDLGRGAATAVVEAGEAGQPGAEIGLDIRLGPG